jgi:hypothetical protein
MTLWHADLDTPALEAGANLTVASDHQVVRVVTSDTLSIETPDGQRFSAHVLDRTLGALNLALGDGRNFALAMKLDESLHHPANARVFSRQVWRTL